MYVPMRQRLLLSLLLCAVAALPMFADDVTISGTVTFSSLDGSALDHDGAANGTFTVDDGNLTVMGTINCLDDGPGNNSACPMSFTVSGNFTMLAGSGIFAENRTGGGTGGNITFNVGGNVSLQSSGPSFTNGAVISSDNLGTPAAGSITMNVGGTTTFLPGTTISAGSKGGQGGAISIASGGAISADGLIASAPSRVLNLASRYSGEVVNGGSSGATGGAISLISTGTAGTGISVGGLATIISQGENGGSNLVLLEGCGIEILGLVASVAKGGSSSAVSVRSGTTVVIDTRDLLLPSMADARMGVLRADSTNGSASSFRVDVFARAGIEVLGPASAFFSVNSSGTNVAGGSIRVISSDSTVTASGSAFRAASTTDNDNGGSISVSAKDDVVLDTATLAAIGGLNGTGGSIAVRSHSGGVSWENGVGDARPTGSSIAVAKRGSIALTYCTTVSTSGSSFPTNGAPVGTYPSTTNSCSPAAPSLPLGVTLPDCNEAPVAVDDEYTVAEGGTLNELAPGVLGNDSDADGDPITATLVDGPDHAASFTFNADGSFNYVHDGSETTTDSFTYTATDGSLTSNIATVTITITPVNDAPVAVDDNYSVNEGGTINLAAPGVLVNDSDPDGPTMTAVLDAGPLHASSFVLNPDGSFNYVHDGSETTSDSFTYHVSDGSLNSNIATVSITITPVNDAPVANDDGPYNVTFHGTINVPPPGVLTNDTDAEGNGLIAVLVSGTTQGTLALHPNGSFDYTHTGATLGTDSFTYVAEDTFGAQSAPATVTINIVNLAPTATDDSFTGVGNTELRVGTGSAAHPAAVVSGSVLANDADPDSGPSPLFVSAFDATSANGGTVTMNANGTFNYLPATGFVGSDTFNYTISDGIATDTGTVTINSTDRVWYVNPAAAGPQTGRSPDPFMTIGQAQGASSINDYIHVAQGAQATGILLKNGQRLIGSGVPLVVGPYTLAPATVRPTLGSTVILASANTVSGLNIAAIGDGISGNAVAGGAISEVGITGGADGISLTNTTGSFGLVNVTIAPGLTGLAINGGTANVTSTNVTITTTGSTGLLGTGTGTLHFVGGTITTVNGTAVDLTNHTVTGGLTAVNASNGVDGIRLVNTGGNFAVNGTGTAGSGGTITGMSDRGVDASNAAGVTLNRMNISNNANQGVFVFNTLASASLVNVQNSDVSNNISNAVQTISTGSGVMSVTVNGNTFTNNNSAIAIQTTSGGMVVKVTNNTTTFNQSNAINVIRSAPSAGAVDATVTGNVIGTLGVPGSGAACGGGCNGIQVTAIGSNTFNLLLSANTVRQIDSTGIRVFAQQGSSSLNATITNNLVEDPSLPDASIGIHVQSGAVSADTTAVCASITGNTVTGGYPIDIFVRNNSAGSTFRLPGYAGSGTDLTAVQNFILANNTVTTVLAQRKTTVPANQFTGGAACPTPAP